MMRLAVTRSRAALDAVHELGHAYTLSHVLHLNCWLHQHRGNPTVVREQAEVALKLPAERGFRSGNSMPCFGADGGLPPPARLRQVRQRCATQLRASKEWAWSISGPFF